MEGLQFLLKAVNNQNTFSRMAELEEKLSETYPVNSLLAQVNSVAFGAVAEKLEAGEVLVEYIRAVDFSYLTSGQYDNAFEFADAYYAFVIVGDDKNNPRLLRLGSAEEIDVTIGRYRTAICGSSESSGTVYWLEKPTTTSISLSEKKNPEEIYDLGCSIRQSILDPIFNEVPGKSSFVIATDGAINLLPLHSLPLDESVFVVDVCEISYLNTGRDLLGPADRESPKVNKSIVIAAPDYDLEIYTEPNYPGPSAVRDGSRGRSLNFPALDGSRIEGECVADLINANFLTGANATTTAVTGCASPEILHIATHGFYLGPAPKKDISDTVDESSRLLSRLRTGLEPPLMRSGVALAGANTWLHGGTLPKEAGTGFLTALEMSAMDLSGTKLVVLSACESGLGDIQDGQGTLGLRHGAFVAGARWVIVTLWPVPDTATAEIMSAFYRIWNVKSSPHLSLRQAQQELRVAYPAVRDWGAFICVGRPTPIAEQGPKGSEAECSSAPSGMEALRQLSKMSFSKLLSDAVMQFTLPTGFHVIDVAPEDQSLHQFAARSVDRSVEIRYAVLPSTGGHRCYFSEADYYNVAHEISNGPPHSSSIFPDEGVRSEFGAHSGITTTIQNACISVEYSWLILIFVKRHGVGSALISYLFNDIQDILPILTTEFNSLRFRGDIS